MAFKIRCALVIGHKHASPGAVNAATGLSEFDFNDRLSIEVQDIVRRDFAGIPDVIRIYRRTYAALPRDVNESQSDFAVSMHCNAFAGVDDAKPSGTETLYYHRSTDGLQLAGKMQVSIVRALGLRDRGVRKKHAEDRGGCFLAYTRMPSVICEPFFIDNDDDLKIARESDLALGYARGLNQCAELLQSRRDAL